MDSGNGVTPDTKPGIGRTIKRSGVRLYSKCSNHKHLNRILAQLKDVIGDSKTLSGSYATSLKDMEKWASKEEYGALGDVFTGVAEIASLQLEIQREQMEIWTEFRRTFETILEGERNLDEKRSKLEEIEAKEVKIKKELKKRSGNKKISSSDLTDLSEKLQMQEKETESEKKSVALLTKENEALKLMHTKKGLIKLFEGLKETNEKSQIILSAQKYLAEALPDVPNNTENLNELPYEGSVHTARIVLDTKEQIKNYRRCNSPPPSYSQNQMPFNPYYANSANNNGGGGLYPPVTSGDQVEMHSAFQKLGVSAYD